jgi:hypothetical protein
MDSRALRNPQIVGVDAPARVPNISEHPERLLPLEEAAARVHLTPTELRARLQREEWVRFDVGDLALRMSSLVALRQRRV